MSDAGETSAANFYAKMQKPEPPQAESVVTAARSALDRGQVPEAKSSHPDRFARCGGSWRGHRDDCGGNR
jgi:hypothetical protein